MDFWISQLKNLSRNIQALGARKIGILLATTLAATAAFGFAIYQIGKPANETLYASLPKQESARIAMALRDSAIDFDTSSDGSVIYVKAGQAPRARMILAQRGLPNASGGGYELFEKVGAFGLTTFMQDITRTRAIEGELARTLQMIEGVRFARVHLVIPERTQLRTTPYEPTAAVVLHVDGNKDRVPVTAIRHLVASAVPKLASKNITIALSDGELLSGPSDSEGEGVSAARRIESEIARSMRKNVEHAISPYTKPENYRVAVSVKVNTDRREIAERTYLPDSKVEKSVKVTRESSEAQNPSRETQVSIQQNIPRTEQAPTDERRRSETSQKREELTNFEISSKTINTVSGGYTIQNLSVAVSLNSQSLPPNVGQSANRDKADELVRELEALIAAAVGLDKNRGDHLKVAIADFGLPPEKPDLNQGSQTNWVATILPALINIIGIFAILALAIFAVIRPLMSTLAAPKTPNVAGATYIALPGKDPEQERSDDHPIASNSQLAVSEKITDARAKLKDAILQDRTSSVLIMKEWLKQST